MWVVYPMKRTCAGLGPRTHAGRILTHCTAARVPCALCGRSSVVEQLLPKQQAAGSNPVARFEPSENVRELAGLSEHSHYN